MLVQEIEPQTKSESSRAVHLLTLVIFAFLLVALWPLTIRQMAAHVDGQMQWALNFLSSKGYLFGKDAVFTFGPLGYILVPLNIGINQFVAIGLQLLFYSSLLLAALSLLWKNKYPWAALAFASMLLLAAPFGGYIDCTIELLIAVLACCILVFPSAGLALAIGLGILAASTIFMKFSLGIGALSLVVVSSLCWQLKYKELSHKWIIALITSCVASFLGLAVYLLHSTDNLFLWLKGSFEIVSGYSDAISLSGSAFEPLSALAILLLYIGSLIYFARIKSNTLLPACLMLPVLMLAYKHSFVRQDPGHFSIFICQTLGTLAFLFLFTQKKRESFIILTLFGISLVTFNSWQLEDRLSLVSLQKTLQCKDGIEHIMSLRHIHRTMLAQEKENQRCLERFRLSPEALSLLKKNGATTDVVPCNIFYCPANGLKWNPNPIFELYAAYTPYLEGRSSAHFTDKNAPIFILTDFEEIDNRNTLLSNPGTWRAILANYHYTAIDTHGVLLLSKNFKPAQVIETLPLHTKTTFGEWVDVPSFTDLLYGKIDLKRSLAGTILGVLYQIPPINIELKFASNKRMSYRLIPKVLESGILLNYLPTNLNELEDLFHHQSHDRIIQFRITTNGAEYFSPNIQINWYKDGLFPVQLVPKAKMSCSAYKFSPKKTYAFLDYVCGKRFQENQPVILKADDALILSGWAVDEPNKLPASAVFIEIDKDQCFQADYGLRRSDVANYTRNSNYVTTGFTASLPASSLSKGKHLLRLRVISKDNKCYYRSDLEIEVEKI